MTGVLVLLLTIHCDWYDLYVGDRHMHAHTSNIQVDWYTGIVTDFVYKMVTNFFLFISLS